jgi:hypothetical protein
MVDVDSHIGSDTSGADTMPALQTPTRPRTLHAPFGSDGADLADAG